MFSLVSDAGSEAGSDADFLLNRLLAIQTQIPLQGQEQEEEQEKGHNRPPPGGAEITDSGHSTAHSAVQPGRCDHVSSF